MDTELLNQVALMQARLKDMEEELKKIKEEVKEMEEESEAFENRAILAEAKLSAIQSIVDSKRVALSDITERT